MKEYSFQNMDQIIRSHKIRVTPQRTEVYRALVESGKHLNADEIYLKVRKKMPSISLGTVYAILQQFRVKGLVRENLMKRDKAAFDARVDNHHHFSCRVCGSVWDIDLTLCAPLKRKEIEGNVIEYFQGYFYGVCKNCKGKIK